MHRKYEMHTQSENAIYGTVILPTIKCTDFNFQILIQGVSDNYNLFSL